MRETPPGKVVEEVCAAEITHLWRAGERLIRLANGGSADIPAFGCGEMRRRHGNGEPAIVLLQLRSG
jgi:hypothetical protein